MGRAWMPLYIGDYLRDTGHLTTLQHGAYLLLIMHYWEHGGLPAADAEKARVCRLTGRQWSSNCLALASLFHDGWKHKRIDAELEKQRIISEKRQVFGKKGGEASRGKNNVQRFVDQANAKQKGTQSQSHINRSTFLGTEKRSSEGFKPLAASAELEARIKAGMA
jgi:uncharacterized protein YdaU (DUF1376 family)